MEVAEKVLYVVHMGGLLAILVGWVLAARRPANVEVMAWGARIQVLVGFVLVAVLASELSEERAAYWIPLKLLIALGVLTCAEIARARGKAGQPQPMLIHLAGVLTLVNVVVAFVVH